MERQVRYEALDWLRGLAAIGVMFFHFSIIGLPIAPHGYLAVDLFFILSGFVMSHAYSDRLINMKFSRFLKIRLIRIVPLSVIGLLAGTSYFLFRYYIQSKSQYDLRDIISGTVVNLFLLPKPWVTPTPTDTIFPSNTPLWSLSLEVFINFVWAAFVFNSRSYVFIVISFISFAVLAAFSIVNGSADIGATWPTYIGGASRAVFGFFVGILLWRYRPRPESSSLLPIISTIALLLIIFSPDFGALYDLLIIAIIFPLLIYITSSADYRIERPFFKLIGNLSYPLYVIHVPVLHFFVGISKSFKIGDSSYLVAVSASIVCIAAAVILDLIYDRPARRVLTKVFVP